MCLNDHAWCLIGMSYMQSLLSREHVCLCLLHYIQYTLISRVLCNCFWDSFWLWKIFSQQSFAISFPIPQVTWNHLRQVAILHFFLGRFKLDRAWMTTPCLSWTSLQKVLWVSRDRPHTTTASVSPYAVPYQHYPHDCILIMGIMNSVSTITFT